MRISELGEDGKFKLGEPDKKPCPYCSKLFQRLEKHKGNCHLNPVKRGSTIKYLPHRCAMLCECNHPKTYHKTRLDERTGIHGCDGHCQHVDCNCERYVFERKGFYVVVV